MNDFLHTRHGTLRGLRFAQARPGGRDTFDGGLKAPASVSTCPSRLQEIPRAPEPNDASSNLPALRSRERIGFACFICS